MKNLLNKETLWIVKCKIERLMTGVVGMLIGNMAMTNVENAWAWIIGLVAVQQLFVTVYYRVKTDLKVVIQKHKEARKIKEMKLIEE